MTSGDAAIFRLVFMSCDQLNACYKVALYDQDGQSVAHKLLEAETCLVSALLSFSGLFLIVFYFCDTMFRWSLI